jgi:hypothetical protein
MLLSFLIIVSVLLVAVIVYSVKLAAEKQKLEIKIKAIAVLAQTGRNTTDSRGEKNDATKIAQAHDYFTDVENLLKL